MFKFFRKYNGIILAVGATLLMVAFLIQPTISAFMPSEGARVVATAFDGERQITVGDQHAALAEVELLQRVGLGVDLSRDNEPIRWLLILADARRLGLHASDYEVALLRQAVGLDDDALARLAGGVRGTPAGVQQALRNWIIFQQYRELTFGLAHVGLPQRLQLLASASGQLQQARGANPMLQRFFIEQARATLGAAQGAPRIGEPALQRFIQDQMATVKLALVSLPANLMLPEVPEPAGADLQALFDQYKDQLPGEHGDEQPPFGYRSPDRVKIEYLAVSLAQVRPTVQVDEAQLLAYYEAHRDEFRAAPDKDQPGDLLSPSGQLQPYTQVRDRILDRLSTDQAADRADAVIKFARSLLLDDARALPEAEGYRVVPDDFAPMPLTDLQQRIQNEPRFAGILPSVQRDDQHWMSGADLAAIPGLGQARVAGSRPVPAPDYILSTRKLDDASPLALQLRLQAKLPSQPLVGPDGTRYLVRVIAAEPAASPASLDAVREQVVADARRLAAYRLLVERKDIYLEQARGADQGLKVLAQGAGVEVIDTPRLPRRDMTVGRPAAPEIPGLGASAAVIDAAFDRADALLEQVSDPAKIVELPENARLFAAGNEPSLSLVVARIDDYRLITRSAYDRFAGAPQIGSYVLDALLSQAADTHDLAPSDAGQVPDPMSLGALAARTAFAWSDGRAIE